MHWKQSSLCRFLQLRPCGLMAALTQAIDSYDRPEVLPVISTDLGAPSLPGYGCITGGPHHQTRLSLRQFHKCVLLPEACATKDTCEKVST